MPQEIQTYNLETQHFKTMMHYQEIIHRTLSELTKIYNDHLIYKDNKTMLQEKAITLNKEQIMQTTEINLYSGNSLKL